MKSHRTIVGLRSQESLLAALETLRRAPDGAALLAQIERGHQLQTALAAMVEQAFLAFLQNSLDRYQRRPGIDATTRLKTKVIARHAAALADAGADSEGAPQLSLPLLQDIDALEQHLVAMLWTASVTLAQDMRHSAADVDADARAAPAAAAARDEQIKPVVDALTHKLDQALVSSADNIVRLKIVADSLTTADAVLDLEEIRELLRDAVRELLEDNQALDERLQEAHASANDIAFKIAAPAPASDLVGTGRHTLLRRMQVEARRAERYHLPLSLALLGPDYLGDMDRLVGLHAGREVIRLYMEGVSACARAYDVIAPCDPHGLVWLLPGTEIAQGVHALRKVRQYFGDTRYHYGGRLRPLPTFSAAIVGYVSGENPTTFLERAETLAARAKSAGPGRIECES